MQSAQARVEILVRPSWKTALMNGSAAERKSVHVELIGYASYLIHLHDLI